jgi:hypothetical protein
VYEASPSRLSNESVVPPPLMVIELFVSMP